jgi:hypothetical protein
VEAQKRIPFAFEAILAGNILLGLMVAVMSPNTVLTDSQILSAFTDFIASFILGIDRLAKVSQFPEVTRFTSAVLWATVPVQALAFSYPGVLVPRLEMIKQRKAFFFLAWLMMPLMTLMLIVASIHDPTPDLLARKSLYAWAFRNVSESRMWLGVFGGLVACISAAFLSGFFTFWPRTWAVYFGPKT